MNFRLSLIFVALAALLGAMAWVIQDRRSTPSSPLLAADRVLLYPTAPINAPSAAPATSPAVAAEIPPVAPPVEPAPVKSAPVKSAPMVRVASSGEVKYVARAGDTVSQLAIALLGSDSKEHRDAVIDANPSLQANPDRVLEGQTYSLALAPVAAVEDAAVPQAKSADAGPSPEADAPTPAPLRAVIEAPNAPKLRYVAQPGDTVGVLAAHLLGGDTKANRDTIVAGNPQLQQNPDHLVAGQEYTIVAPNGLAADPAAAPARIATTQPDADDVTKLSVGRSLRYTARPGDSVSKLATVLLGSDSPANRELIVRSNPSLKQDPDHLVAGQTYWINAPTP